MTTEQIAICLLLAATLALFAWGRWRYDVVAFATLLAAVVLGLVPAREAFTGFGHPATVTVAAILILSHTLARTGASEVLARLIERSARGMARHIAVLAGLGALMSSVMNNVAALGLLMPAAIQTTAKTRYHAGAVLMPLSFATILGGLITLLGTPPNIIIAAVRERATQEPFAMFDFTPVGLLVSTAGVAFLALSARYLIPRRRQVQNETGEHMNIDKFVTEATVVKGTDAVGMTRGELRMLATDCDVLVVSIIRRGRRMARLPMGEGLKTGDKLLLESTSEGLDRLTTAMDLKVGTMKGAKSEHMIDEDMDLVGAPAAALAMPTPTHAQEMTKTASGLEYYDVKVGQGDGPAKLDNTVTIDCACPASFALQYTPPTRFPRRHRLAQRLRGQGVFEV